MKRQIEFEQSVFVVRCGSKCDLAGRAALGANRTFGWPRTSHRGHERTNSNLAAVGANAQARNAAFHSWRPVLADQGQSRQGCLPRIRPRIELRLHD